MTDTYVVDDSTSPDESEDDLWYEPEREVALKHFKFYSHRFVQERARSRSWRHRRALRSRGISMYKHGLPVAAEPVLDVIAFASSGAVEPGVRRVFVELADTWERETRFLSSVSAITSNPAYLAMIGLGPEVIPLILERLAERPNHWFKALVALTRIDAAKDETTMAGATSAWLEWGRRVGLVSA